MLSKPEINAFKLAWCVDTRPARKRVARARMHAFRARREQGVRRTKGLPVPEAEPDALVLPEVIDSASMRQALLQLAKWSRDSRVSWDLSMEAERELNGDFCRAMKLQVQTLFGMTRDADP